MLIQMSRLLLLVRAGNIKAEVNSAIAVYFRLAKGYG